MFYSGFYLFSIINCTGYLVNWALSIWKLESNSGKFLCPISSFISLLFLLFSVFLELLICSILNLLYFFLFSLILLNFLRYLWSFYCLFWELNNFYSSSGFDPFLYIANCSWFTDTISEEFSLRILTWEFFFFFFKFSSAFLHYCSFFQIHILFLSFWRHSSNILWSLIVHLYLREGDSETDGVLFMHVEGGSSIVRLCCRR